MTLQAIKEKAINEGIPIIEDDGLAYILNCIEDNHVKNILEIGTAVGYSALQMAAFDVEIDTIERDPIMLEQALKNVSNHEHGHKVHVIAADAKTYEGPLKQYDLIFIDGAKSQYIRFFNKYQKYLNQHGMIICDNLYFHHLDINTVTNKHTKALLRKLKAFREFLNQHPQFETTFVDVGDGLSVSKRVIK